MGNHWKDLIVWQKSHLFVIEVYKLLAGFPKEERYHIIEQIKRAATSVSANIVEGHSRNSQKEFIRFLYISRGSLEELRYFILLSKDLGYIQSDIFEKLE